MHGNPALSRPKAATQNFAKIAAAFLIGLVTVFASALMFSNLEQKGELASVAPSSQAEQAPSAIASQTPRAEEATSPIKLVTPQLPKRNGTIPLGAPVQVLTAVRKPVVTPSAAVRPEMGQSSRVNTPLPLGAHSNIASQLPPSVPTQESVSTSSAEHHNSIREPLQPTPANPPQAHSEPVSSPPVSTVVVPATTILTVQLADTLSSDNNQLGDTFQGRLAAPLIVNGYLLAETGSIVRGRIEAVRKASLLGGRSELSIALTEISMRDGQRRQVRTGAREAKGARAIAGGSGFIARTRVAVLPAGAQLTFILTAPLTVTGVPAH